MTNQGIGILATESYIPYHENSNADVCHYVDGLTEDWIIEKTGIKRRYHMTDFVTVDAMAFSVATSLCDKLWDDIGLLIISSFSQPQMFPPLSAKVHQYLKLNKDCQVIDINTNCTGLITGTTIAVERMKANPKIKYAIVIGVEALSPYVDKTDKFTAPFFSDGASGVLLGRVPYSYGYINSKFATDSSVYDEVKLERDGYIYQNGKATWTQAITNVPYVMKGLVHDCGLVMKDVDFFIFHQANKVMIDYIMDKHRIPHHKTYTNVQEIGNTGAASIGIALDEAFKKGLIKKDMLLMLVGVGAGFNFGASLWKIQ